MTNKQFEQIECLSKKLWEDINNGHEYSMVTYTEFLGIVTEVWEGLQEVPASDDLEEASKYYALNNTPWDDCKDEIQESFKAGAKWKEKKMMANAIGGVVTFDYYYGDKTYGCVAHDSFCLEDFGLKDRDEVKVIVIKED